MSNSRFDPARDLIGQPGEYFSKNILARIFGTDSVYWNDLKKEGRPDLRVEVEEKKILFFEVEVKQSKGWAYLHRGPHVPLRKLKALTYLSDDPQNTYVMMVKDDLREFLIIKGSDLVNGRRVNKPCPKREDFMEVDYDSVSHFKVLDGKFKLIKSRGFNK